MGERWEVVVLWSADRSQARKLLILARVGGAGSRIRRRFRDTGVAGLATRPKAGRKDHAVPAATVERRVELAPSLPSAGRRRSITRLLAQKSALTPGGVSAPRRNGLKPPGELPALERGALRP
jgi:hypothetical protein